MAKLETTIANPSNKSPELSTALLELQYMKVREMELMSLLHRSPHQEDEYKAMMKEFVAPFHEVIEEAEYLIHAGDNTLGGFFYGDFTGDIWKNEAASESLKLIWPDMTESQKDEIAMTVALGFVAGMIFSGATGAVLTTDMRQRRASAASSQEVVNA
jgi:hypothetical protein